MNESGLSCCAFVVGRHNHIKGYIQRRRKGQDGNIFGGHRKDSAEKAREDTDSLSAGNQRNMCGYVVGNSIEITVGLWHGRVSQKSTDPFFVQVLIGQKLAAGQSGSGGHSGERPHR